MITEKEFQDAMKVIQDYRLQLINEINNIDNEISFVNQLNSRLIDINYSFLLDVRSVHSLQEYSRVWMKKDFHYFQVKDLAQVSKTNFLKLHRTGVKSLRCVEVFADSFGLKLKP
jgi:hypothetical protein